jgi:hypothetical protein
LSVPVIAAAYHLLLGTTGERARWAPWFVAMFVAAGITVTNLAIVAILLLGSMWDSGRGRFRSALQVSALAVGVTLLTYASSYLLNHVVLGKEISARKSTAWATTFIHEDDFIERFVRFPMAIANTIAPARVATGDPTSSYRPGDRYQFRFTFEEKAGPPTVRNLLGLAALALVAAGAVVSARRRVSFRSVGLVSAAVVGFNWVLHSAWGDETFLYSQHWFVSMLVLMALAVARLEHRRRVATWVVGALVAAVAVNSLGLVSTMLTLLRSHSGPGA